MKNILKVDFSESLFTHLHVCSRTTRNKKLLGAPGIATRSDRTLLGAPGLTTRSKGITTSNKGHRY